MAFPSITGSTANHFPTGFQAIYIRPSGEKYQTLGDIADAEIHFPDAEVINSMGKNRAIQSVNFTAKCKMLQASLVEMELIDSMVNGSNAFLFKAPDAGAVTTGATAGWFLVSAAQANCRAKLIASGTPDTNRYIELEWSGSILLTALGAALKASVATADFESSSDAGAFHAIGLYSTTADGGSPDVSHIMPNGVSSVTIAEWDGTAIVGSAATMGDIENVKIEFDWLSDTNEAVKRYRCYGIGVDIEYDWMDTDAADLLNLEEQVDTEVKVVITMFDGRIFTLSGQVGITNGFNSVGNFDKTRTVKMSHKGKVLKTAFDTIVS